MVANFKRMNSTGYLPGKKYYRFFFFNFSNLVFVVNFKLTISSIIRTHILIITKIIKNYGDLVDIQNVQIIGRSPYVSIEFK